MRVLFIGDVVGQGGCDFVRSRLPLLQQTHQIDVVVVNGENSAEGNGILPSSAQHLFDSGVQVITTGNHGLRRQEIYDMLDAQIGLIRPANFAPEAPGKGYYILDLLRYRLCVINLQGMAFMNPIENPFRCVDRLLQEIDTPNILVDFHAEATAEKVAMGYYLDGRVSAVLGTHTHVQTADEHILPGGTGYITDVGMCGGYHSVLGVRTELALRRFLTGLPTRFENEKQDYSLGGVILDIHTSTGKTTNIERVFIR